MERRIRTGLGALFLLAGAAWSVGFPKKASLAPDMVASVALALGLFGSGLLLWRGRTLRRSSLAVWLVCGWSLLLNVALYSELRAVSRVLLDQARGATETSPFPEER